MKHLETYISFDLEFNTVDQISHIIQVSAVKYHQHQEVETFDTYVYTDVPLQSFINGLTGITADKIRNAPDINKVIEDFRLFVSSTPLIGYNAKKSDLPLLLAHELDLRENYLVDVYEEAKIRRSKDLNGISNLQLHTVAQFLEISGKSHNSLEDARMTALVYEKFCEFDDNTALLEKQEEVTNNPFANLNLSDLLSE